MDQKARPLGPTVDFSGARSPDGRRLAGRIVTLERLDPARHGPAIWDQIKDHPQVWDYLFETPPEDLNGFMAVLDDCAGKPEWMGYAILVDGRPMGYAYYLNIVPAMGSIEVGNINFSPALQRTPAATEAMALMMREAFALGYRRYEWKCNALNMPSRRAAQRLGFSWEGIFRQHFVVKGRNRDTAWFAITDKEWPAINAAFTTWLTAVNFDPSGQQIQSLSALTAPHRVASDPAQSAGATT